MVKLNNLYHHEVDIYSLPGFVPQIVDEDYLRKLGVTALPSAETLEGLKRGSEIFQRRMQQRCVIPVPQLALDEIPELFHRHHIPDDLHHFLIQFILVQGRLKTAEMFLVNLLSVLASVVKVILVLAGFLILPPPYRPGHPGTADRTFQNPG